MNTQSANYYPHVQPATKRPAVADFMPGKIAAKLVNWSLAGSVALAVDIAAFWALTTPAIAAFLAPALWGLGFIFLTLALAVDIKRVLPYIATGLALPVLAVLGSNLAVGFSFVGAVLVAGWVAMWIGRRA